MTIITTTINGDSNSNNSKYNASEWNIEIHFDPEKELVYATDDLGDMDIIGEATTVEEAIILANQYLPPR